MRQLKLLISIGVLCVLLYLYFKRKTLKDIFKNIGFVALGIVIGLIAMWFIKPTQKEIITTPSEIHYRDTCIQNQIIATLTSEDSLSVYRIVKEGIKSNSTNAKPTIEKVVSVDTVITTPLSRQYTNKRIVDNVTIWDTLDVVGEIKYWKYATKTNEDIEVKEKHTTTTAIVEKGTKDSLQIKYLPQYFENSYDKLGLSLGLDYFNDPIIDVGVVYDRHQWSVGIDKDINTKIFDPKGYELKISFKPIKFNKESKLIQ